MSRRAKGSGFKMKSSPAKQGILSDFFGNLGSQLKRGQAERGIFSEKGKAEAKAARKPKWKREHDTRKKEERKRFEEKEIDRILKTNKNWGEVEDTPEVVKEKSVKEKSVKEKSVKGESKIDWTKAPKVGTTARTNWYKKHNLELDPTTPGYKSKIDAVGTGAFQCDPEKENFGATSRVPLNQEEMDSVFKKKSPYKKGLGKYTKKAKGSRGYKMKRK